MKTKYLSDYEKYKRLEFARELTKVCKIFCLKIKAGKIDDSPISPDGHEVWVDYETVKWKDR
jgi:hypothetical protein